MAHKYKGNFINSVKMHSFKIIFLGISAELLLILLSGFALYKKWYWMFAAILLSVYPVYRIFHKKYEILKAGYRGEDTARKMLHSLPKKYTVISDVTIHQGSRQAQMDNVILAPNVVFVLEVKNYSGYLYGTADSRELTQIKYMGNEKVKKTVYNPFMQVRTHAHVLKSLLRENGIDAEVRYGVLFVGDRFRIKFDLADEIAFYYNSGTRKEIIRRLKSFGHMPRYNQSLAKKIIIKN